MLTVVVNGWCRVVAIEFATVEGGLTSSDSQDLVLVTASGTLLRLGDLRLAEFEHLLAENRREAMKVILRNIRFERANVGRLNEGTQSCMLVRGLSFPSFCGVLRFASSQVHRFEQEVYVLLGNHGAHLNVWKTSSIDNGGRTGIEVRVLVDSVCLE